MSFSYLFVGGEVAFKPVDQTQGKFMKPAISACKWLREIYNLAHFGTAVFLCFRGSLDAQTLNKNEFDLPENNECHLHSMVSHRNWLSNLRFGNGLSVLLLILTG